MSGKNDDSAQGMDYLQSVPRRWVTMYIPIGLFVFVLLFPFYWMVITSFKPNEELLSRDGNPFWFIHPTLAHFEKLLAYEPGNTDVLWIRSQILQQQTKFPEALVVMEKLTRKPGRSRRRSRSRLISGPRVCRTKARGGCFRTASRIAGIIPACSSAG